MKKTDDKSINELYGEMRFHCDDARANGYLYHGYFLNEQKILFNSIKNRNGYMLDIGCGTGLMLKPLQCDETTVIGIDYDKDACIASKNNLIKSIRGDAYSIPIKSAVIDVAVCCQFLNQEFNSDLNIFFDNAHRILKENGTFIVIWRNSDAIIHKIALFIFRYINKLVITPVFPYTSFSIKNIEAIALNAGFKIKEKKMIFSPFGMSINNIDGIIAKIFGASNMLILLKNNDKKNP